LNTYLENADAVSLLPFSPESSVLVFAI